MLDIEKLRQDLHNADVGGRERDRMAALERRKILIRAVIWTAALTSAMVGPLVFIYAKL